MKTSVNKMKLFLNLLTVSFCLWVTTAFAAEARLTGLEIDGSTKSNQWVLRADIEPLGKEEQPAIVSLDQNIHLDIQPEKATGVYQLQAEAIQGDLHLLELSMRGKGEVTAVEVKGMIYWSVRSDKDKGRLLVIQMQPTEEPRTQFSGIIRVEQDLDDWKGMTYWEPVRFSLLNEGVSGGYISLTRDAGLDVEAGRASGLTPIELQHLSPWLKSQIKTPAPHQLHYRFFQSAYDLNLNIRRSDPDRRAVVVDDFQLNGTWQQDAVAFHFKGVVKVKQPGGGSLHLLGGDAAMLDVAQSKGAHIRYVDPIYYEVKAGDTLSQIAQHHRTTLASLVKMNDVSNHLIRVGQRLLVPGPNGETGYVAQYEEAGTYPLEFKFLAHITANEGAQNLHFTTVPSVLRPVHISQMPKDAQLDVMTTLVSGTKEEDGEGNTFFASSDGPIVLKVQQGFSDESSRLFFAAESWEEVLVSPGLMRQSLLCEIDIMQGEMTEVLFEVVGEGEIISVDSPQLFGWELEPANDDKVRLLKLKLNEAQSEGFQLRITAQSSLGTFPASAKPVRLFPAEATRYGGWIRIANSGAVRLEVGQTMGLSQISPDQFSLPSVPRGAFSNAGSQVFAYRFASVRHEFEIRADNIVPEIGVSEMLVYHAGLADMSIEAEFELNIREAPVREIEILMPTEFALSGIQASQLADYFVGDVDDNGNVTLKLLFSQPFSGRRVVQLVLEQNSPVDPGLWTLPRLEVLSAKSTRGNLAVTAENGLRAQPSQITGLAEMPAGFFPRQLDGIQSAFRLRDPDWAAEFSIERLDQSVQVDVLHLYTIGEGLAYGSSVMHYYISGAPLNAFEVELSDDYFNLEFTGRDVRDWVQTETGYTVYLHKPVSGAYTLLASYERPFNALGETLTFSGVRPSDAQSEQGYTIITSAYQFRVNPVSVSETLKSLEPAEVPAEHRLFIDSPILAAYHYTALPVELQLELQPLSQGRTLDLVVDRASIKTHVSASGEMITDATYFIKSQGNAMLPISIPEDSRLWSVSVNQKTVAPIQVDDGFQIPITFEQRPDALQSVQIKWAARSERPDRLTVQTAAVGVPVVLAEWVIEPDPGRYIQFRNGSLEPLVTPKDVSGWAALLRVIRGEGGIGKDRLIQLMLAMGLWGVAILVWWYAKTADPSSSRVKFWSGTVLGVAALVFSLMILDSVAKPVMTHDASVEKASIEFLAPVLGADASLTASLDHLDQEDAASQYGLRFWLVLGVVLWLLGLVMGASFRRTLLWGAAWLMVFGASLSSDFGWPGFVFWLGGFYFLHIAGPWMWALFQHSKCKAATAAVLLLLTWQPVQLSAQAGAPWQANDNSATRLEQSLVVKGEQVQVDAKLVWSTDGPANLDLLNEPAILKSIEWSGGKGKVFQRIANGRRTHVFAAAEAGEFVVSFQYEVRVLGEGATAGFTLPTSSALMHQVSALVVGREVDLSCAQAVSSTSQVTGSGDSEIKMVLSPSKSVRFQIQPRVRDARLEEPVFFAEWDHLILPTVGMVEGFHTVSVRLSQGELSMVRLQMPEDWTVAEVVGPGAEGWRFDPELGVLSVPLNPPQQRSFLISLRSQQAGEPLPYTSDIQLPSLLQAEREIGMVAVATLQDVQLTDINVDSLSEIRLEDFSGGMRQMAGRSLNEAPIMRRAFRYSGGEPVLTVSADLVSPDLRVVTQQTLSLGEDRSVLGVNATLSITRAGLFRLDFPMPANMDVESIAGSALSHWTESDQDGVRMVTLHFRDKTIGRTDLQMSFAGPGPDVGNTWQAPRVRFENASKQTGQLTFSTEQGMRLQVESSDGAIQLDPEELGMGNQDAVVFRLLHQDWSIGFDVAQLPPWIQVDGFQFVRLSEGRGEVQTRLKYQIKNAGVRGFRVALPAVAEGVRFQGEHISDYLSSPLDGDADRLEWNLELDRRVIGEYSVTVFYNLPVETNTTTWAFSGDMALDARLQRGYVALGLEGRLQASLAALPSELQTADWQSIPSEWTEPVQASGTRMSFRLIQPDFQIQWNLQRHEVARLLPAQVEKVDLRSVVSDNGTILTEIRMELQPGDKRLLPIGLPEGGVFWFALVNGSSIWPWESDDRILIPLEAASDPNEPTVVEFLYAERLGKPGANQLRFDMKGPEFDLPLENVTWQVFLDEKWNMHRHDSTLQLIDASARPVSAKMDWQQYFQSQSQQQQEQSRTAEQFLNLGNQLLETGDSRFARKAFERAYGLSGHDAAFNEDARVQLHNLKTQQAFLGLNYRNNFIQNQSGAPNQMNWAQNLADEKMQFRQEDVEQLIVSNGDEINEAFTSQAERIIRQQEAAIEKPELLRTTFPQHGKAYTFQQSIQVEDWSDLVLSIDARKVSAGAGMGARFLLLLCLAGFVGIGLIIGRPMK